MEPTKKESVKRGKTLLYRLWLNPHKAITAELFG